MEPKHLAEDAYMLQEDLKDLLSMHENYCTLDFFKDPQFCDFPSLLYEGQEDLEDIG